MKPNQDEVGAAETWHRGATIALGISIIAYLTVALTHSARGIEVLLAVAAFACALAYMGTTIWVYALRSERGREEPSERNEAEADER